MEEGLYCPTGGMDKIEAEFKKAYEVLDNEPKDDKKEAAKDVKKACQFYWKEFEDCAGGNNMEVIKKKEAEPSSEVQISEETSYKKKIHNLQREIHDVETMIV